MEDFQDRDEFTMDETDELTKAVRVFGVAAVICWVALAAGIVYAKIVDPSFVGVLVGIGISPRVYDSGIHRSQGSKRLEPLVLMAHTDDSQ